MVDEMRNGKFLQVFQATVYHMIFDINMDGNLTREERIVTGRHTTDPLASITYLRVISRDSVRITFMLATINYFDVYAANIGNTYLNAPCRENIWTIVGESFAVMKS